MTSSKSEVANLQHSSQPVSGSSLVHSSKGTLRYSRIPSSFIDSLSSIETFAGSSCDVAKNGQQETEPQQLTQHFHELVVEKATRVKILLPPSTQKP